MKRTTPSAGGVSSAGYRAEEVRILGDLDYGQTSPWVSYSATPRYRAFVFSGYGGESVDVTVQGKDRRAFVVLADSSLHPIAGAWTHLSLKLPYRGPDIEVWYIVFREAESRPGLFSVRVNKTADSAALKGAGGASVDAAPRVAP